jgi:hypothetical protein
LNDVVILPALAKSGIGCFNQMPKIHLRHRRIVLPIGRSESCMTNLSMQSRVCGAGSNKLEIFATFKVARSDILATANSAKHSTLVPRRSSIFKFRIYVTGEGPNSLLALVNLTAICEQTFLGRQRSIWSTCSGSQRKHWRRVFL